MSTTASSAASPTNSYLISPIGTYSYTPYARAQPPYNQGLNGGMWPSQALPLPSSALAAEADAPLNLGLDEEEVVWGGESVGLGFGLLSRIKEKTNALLEAIDWDCRLCGKTATDPCVTRCGHLFCWSHLTKHLASVPLCPKCTAPLAMDRDVVQVFGRPKAIPSDAPWTSVNHTPGSRGSAADQNASIRREVASPEQYCDEDHSNSVPPPSASPEDMRSRSSSSLDSMSQDTNPRMYTRRRGLLPLTSIQTVPPNNRDQPGRPPDVFVTTADSDGSRPNSQGLTETAREEFEEDPWVAWRRLSDASTAVPSSQTCRPSAMPSFRQVNLRPPSPKLRTKSFRPGIATHRTASSTDSLDKHIRQSVEVKFIRGNQFDSSGGPKTAESEDEEADGNVIYLHSPSSKKTRFESNLDLQPKIISPRPTYAFTHSALGLEDAVASPISPVTTLTNEDEFKATGRKWFAEHRRRTGADSIVVTPTTTSYRPSDIVSNADFVNLKIAMKEAEGEVEKKKGGVLADPIGRALCVFAVVLLVKILLK